MSHRYKISLIVPIYGVERYIAQCAKSVLGQTYEDIQFIFVNDGTKDRSMEILGELIEAEFSHLKERILIINKENGGLPSARKAGLEAAEGEYILFADSDD
ncbi:MAG: glycosyltransferase family 2 protein, partial [Alistipes sp.]|nr:glycosyltransferase family 2 protein [Alistipes sp.]